MTAETLYTDADGDRLVVYLGQTGGSTLGVASDSGEVYVSENVLAAIRAALSGEVVISMTREDATELARILMEERMRLDKDGRRPVPQPRWGANVRIAHAVAAALDSTPEG